MGFNGLQYSDWRIMEVIRYTNGKVGGTCSIASGFNREKWDKIEHNRFNGLHLKYALSAWYELRCR